MEMILLDVGLELLMDFFPSVRSMELLVDLPADF